MGEQNGKSKTKKKKKKHEETNSIQDRVFITVYH